VDRQKESTCIAWKRRSPSADSWPLTSGATPSFWRAPATLAYINGIGQRLAAQIGGPRFTYSFTVVADDTSPLHDVTGFPGGFLFVPAPLILAAKDADELAGMIAHAMALVASRDATHQATRAELIETSTASVNQWFGSNAMPQITGMPLVLLKMWRKLELDADRCASASMSAAGYDPRALARYYDREQASYDEYAAKMFSPLPGRGQRVDAINDVISQLPPQVYSRHEGIEKTQEEIRKLVSNSLNC
jgi:predicted Zn-dependent protease